MYGQVVEPDTNFKKKNETRYKNILSRRLFVPSLIPCSLPFYTTIAFKSYIPLTFAETQRMFFISCFPFKVLYPCSHIISLCGNRFWCSKYFPFLHVQKRVKFGIYIEESYTMHVFPLDLCQCKLHPAQRMEVVIISLVQIKRVNMQRILFNCISVIDE